MGGCVSSPKESDMNEVESLHDNPLSETAVAKVQENNGEDQKEVAPTELPKETTSTEVAAEMAVAATSEKVDEAIADPSEKVEVAVTEANAAESAKEEVVAPENVAGTEQVVKEESAKEESKESLVTV